MIIKKKRYLEHPEKKKFGWSYYTEEIITSFPPSEKILVQETIVRGKKFCIFNKFV